MTVRLKLSMLFVLLMMIAKPAHADVSQEGQIWTAFLSTAKPKGSDSGLRFWLDMHLRRSSSNIVHIARPSIGWSFTPSVSGWAGYAWVPVLPDEGEYR